jgi:hypothetical protein
VPSDRFWVEQAIHRAARRLAGPRCAQVLSDFRDGSGRLLSERLAVFGVTPAAYVMNWIWFIDGRDQPLCDPGYGRAAFTQAGSRVIFICPRTFVEPHLPGITLWSEMVIIHEALHALGLGEDPPTSEQITRQVLARCGGEG